jgi:hypothetical protein
MSSSLAQALAAWHARRGTAVDVAARRLIVDARAVAYDAALTRTTAKKQQLDNLIAVAANSIRNQQAQRLHSRQAWGKKWCLNGMAENVVGSLKGDDLLAGQPAGRQHQER